MTKATTLEQFAMLANDAADYTDERVEYAITTAVTQAVEQVKEKSGFVYSQSTVSAVWNITHDLDVYPSVTVVDSGGNLVIGDVRYTGPNTLTIRFSAPFSGTAYLS